MNACTAPSRRTRRARLPQHLPNSRRFDQFRHGFNEERPHEAPGRQKVGLIEMEDGNTLVRFVNIDLGIIDTKDKIFRRFTVP